MFIIDHVKILALLVFQYRIISGPGQGYCRVLTQNDIDPIVKLALDEDIGSGDITAG